MLTASSTTVLAPSFTLSVALSAQSPLLSPSDLSNEGVVDRAHSCQRNNRPSCADNLLVLESETHIPSQMPQSVQAVEEERCGKESLEPNLDSRGPRSNRRNH